MSEITNLSPYNMITGTVTASSFRPAPLLPAQILGGNPVARSSNIGRSADRKFSVNLWDCTAGRFQWNFESDEIIHVLEGSVTISPHGGTIRTLEAGDVAFFPSGLATVWEIPDYFKKLAVHRDVPRSIPQRVVGKLRKVLTRSQA